jgi:hypothetical protein
VALLRFTYIVSMHHMFASLQHLSSDRLSDYCLETFVGCLKLDLLLGCKEEEPSNRELL